MFEAISIIVVTLFFVGTCIKTWLHRHELHSLSSSEWLQYTIGLIISMSFAIIVIIAGVHEIDEFLPGIIGALLKLLVMFVGLFITSALFIKLLPEKIKPYYQIIDF